MPRPRAALSRSALPRSAQLMAAGFVASGIVHLVKPKVYEPIMPPWVPAHREVILGSGIAEILCGIGMAIPATRRAASYAGVGILLGVFPAHVQMTQDAHRSRDPKMLVASYLRMPLQVPMIRAALAGARSA